MIRAITRATMATSSTPATTRPPISSGWESTFLPVGSLPSGGGDDVITTDDDDVITTDDDVITTDGDVITTDDDVIFCGGV